MVWLTTDVHYGTFGPVLTFQNVPPLANTSPAGGFQHFGQVSIDGGSAALTPAQGSRALSAVTAFIG